MGLLEKFIVPSLAIVAGCYEPELRDCTVRCSAESDCAVGQVCGADHMCAAPDVAGHCENVAAVVDAGVVGDGAKPQPDARPDAPPPPDAPTHGQLHLKIEGGRGRITVQGIGTCTDECTYTVLLGTQLAAEAAAVEEWRFDKWTNGPCIGQSANCVFSQTFLVDVTAKFKKD